MKIGAEIKLNKEAEKRLIKHVNREYKIFEPWEKKYLRALSIFYKLFLTGKR